MIQYNLPFDIEIDDKLYHIRDNGDYRVVLDVICALNDFELEEPFRIQCALFIFYEDVFSINNNDIEKAFKEMLKFINLGEDDEENANEKSIMDWEQDFNIIAPPINSNLGYDVRNPNQYTHWWTFLGGYMEIGESTFSTVVSIRKKKQKGEKLDKWEQEFYRKNHKMVDLPQHLTEEEKEALYSPW